MKRAILFGSAAIVLAALWLVVSIVRQPLPHPLDPACRQWLADHQPAPGAVFGLRLSTDSVRAELKVDQSVEVVELTSTGSTGFGLCGYPYMPGAAAGLVWNPASATIRPGETASIAVETFPQTHPGTYAGDVLLVDLTSGLTRRIRASITVLSP